MKIHALNPGSFKLDGGATFGVVPKTMWQKVYPADENNLCLFSLRNLLIEEKNRLILIDTGIGNKQSEKFYKYYYRSGHHSIEKSIQEAGFSADDVTDVILTHMHFDHVGDATKYNESGKLIPTFKNATYYVSKNQWRWALDPNQREKASYLSENFMPLKEAGVLKLISANMEFMSGIELRMYNGHTQGLLIPFIQYNDKTFVYTSDLIPMSAQIPPSWVCGYDTQPLESMKERKAFLEEAEKNNYYLIFQHDYYTECCTVKKTEKGIELAEKFELSKIL